MLVLAETLTEIKDHYKVPLKLFTNLQKKFHQVAQKVSLKQGCLDDLDNVFGIHLLPMGPLGSVGYHAGYSFNGRAYMKLKIQGKGGHGSSPHLANDAIVAGAYFVMQFKPLLAVV